MRCTSHELTSRKVTLGAIPHHYLELPNSQVSYRLIGGAGHAAVGSRAPEFTLPDQDGRDVSLTGLLSRGPIFLYFYPADFTPGCTRQACAIRDLNVNVYEEVGHLIGEYDGSGALLPGNGQERHNE